MKEIILIIALTLILASQKVVAQISSPGLGDANTASWMAFGIRQDLDSVKQIQSMTYVGMGCKSNLDNYNPFYKPAIFVINQEFYHQFHPHFQYSGALSYRSQSEYASNPPYEKEDPGIKQEIRLYGRFSYIVKIKKVKLVTTYRQEFRKYYTPDFTDWPETFQLRSRFRIQAQLSLNKNKTQRLIGSYEALFSISKEDHGGWTPYSYAESRLCLYYSISPKESPFIFNIGYMNDLIGSSSVMSVHYIAMDIIWEDPFKFLRRSKDKIQENLE